MMGDILREPGIRGKDFVLCVLVPNAFYFGADGTKTFLFFCFLLLFNFWVLIRQQTIKTKKTPNRKSGKLKRQQ